MAKEKSGLTIKDVAKRANVTAQTVSRVMHSSGYVSEKTRIRVLDAIKELNYIPSYAAKALRNGMAKSIAIIFDSLRNYYFGIMIDYLREEIKNRDYSLQLLFSDTPVVTEDTYRKAISHGAVGVLSFLEGEEGLGKAVKDCGVPLMIVGRSTSDENLDYITTDDVYGGRLAAQNLVSKGCTRFQYVMYGAEMSCVQDRGKGFREYLSEHGFSCEDVDIFQTDVEDYSQVALSDPKCGIFCFNDVLAFSVLNRMSSDKNHRAKLVGYDNIQTDMVLPVHITTIGTDKQQMAHFTLEKLQQRLEGGSRITDRQSVSIFGET